MAFVLPVKRDEALPAEAAGPRGPVDERAALAKETALIAWLVSHRRVLVGFSGGVDSAYLAVVARQALGRDGVLAVIGRSASFPAEQWALARAVATAHDIDVAELETDELDDPDYAANPVNRCYHCKKTLWRQLMPVATEQGGRTVIDGTNADDLLDHRPGGRAAEEYGVRSPLAELGFGKAEIRLRSRLLGIETWDRPSAPCLASRLPYGLAVTPQRLAEVERAEGALRALGVTGNVRVRHHDVLARLELDAQALQTWTAPATLGRLVLAVQGAGFRRVAIDVLGFRSGSLNVLGGVRTEAVPTPSPVRAGDAVRWAASLPAPIRLGGLRVWALSSGETSAALADPACRQALMVRTRDDGGTHAALELSSP